MILRGLPRDSLFEAESVYAARVSVHLLKACEVKEHLVRDTSTAFPRDDIRKMVVYACLYVRLGSI